MITFILVCFFMLQGKSRVGSTRASVGGTGTSMSPKWYIKQFFIYEFYCPSFNFKVIY
ncbi:hypothetical protein Fmac_029770 [Flemingia macrophylla]|uniref:Uncharacterized protein n=1 Tax=Flemingia macrophylla TaxID=520843 RepID=A0ABD1LB94_9FABA